MICVIEPHADDAFLSLGGHIEQWTKESPVTVVTVYSGTRKRARDAEAYARAVKAHWLGLECEEGCEPAKVRNALQGWLLSQDYYRQYILPVGVSHPEHKVVRDAAERFLPNIRAEVSYYLDQPYASMPKHSEAVSDAAHFMKLSSWLKPHARKYRHIPLFRDQAKFFHFNPAEKLKHNVEVIFQ